tara:strand:- start:276 stop:1355 length:1080 start_codon:yes stop_codon:yes gene_type:complete
METALYHILNKFKGQYDKQIYNEIYSKNCLLLEDLKRNKNKIDNQKNWDIAKKYANRYEFIFSFNNDGVANVVPISRSYFKLIEILNDNKVLFNDFVIKAACICEGPGGFIQAINDVYRNKLEPVDCITLLSNDKRVPNWKLKNISNYKICYGCDNTGNIYNMDNIIFFVNTVGANSCNLVTADGGFDFSKNFNAQEKDFLLLMLCEIYICLNIQKEGGVFVIKVFDLFDINTINMIALLRLFYDKITIQKPKTSRPANSEKYLICSNFTLKNKHILEYLKKQIINGVYFINDIISLDLKLNTLIHIYEYNTQFVSSQIFYINKTLELLHSNNFEKNTNIKNCIEWCKKYNIPVKSNLV